MININELMLIRENELDKNFIENFKFNKYTYDKSKEIGYYAFDIETTSIKEENRCIVYSTMLMDINSDDDICLHNGNKKDLVDNLENLPYLETTIYAHNGGRFDFNCILDEFIKRGYEIVYANTEDISDKYVTEKRLTLKNEETKKIKILFKNNTLYSVEINIETVPVEFYKSNTKNHKKGGAKKYRAKKLFLKDTCLMLTGELKKVCKDYMNLSLPKDGLRYDNYRDENYKLTDEEKKYCYEDVFSLKYLVKQEFLPKYLIKDKNGIEIFNKSKSEFLTSAGFSLDILKSFMYYDCILTDNYKNNYTNPKAIELVEEFKKIVTNPKNILKIKNNKKDLFRFLFPNLSLKDDELTRLSYFGGLSSTGEELHKINKTGEYSYKHNEIGCVIDENSMYPDKMRNYRLPFGCATKLNNREFSDKYLNNIEDDKMFIASLRFIGKCELKKDKFPTVRIGGECNRNFSKKDIFINNKIDNCYVQFKASMTSIEYNDFKDSYDFLKGIVEDNLVFDTNKGFFTTFIDYFYDIKSNSGGAVKQNAKLILNSVYGKFGTKKKNDMYKFTLEDNVFLPLKEEKQSISESVYVPIASAITSYARHDLKLVAETVGVEYVDYFDTDSLHFRINKEYVESKFKKIDDKKLGYWTIESEFKGGIYLGSKRYAENIKQKDESYKWEVKCCGIPKNNQEYFANNIDLFDYCSIEKKIIQKGLDKNFIKPCKENGLYYFNDCFVKYFLTGVCQTVKTNRGIDGIVFQTRPYMINR